jgi:hypothetical protein
MVYGKPTEIPKDKFDFYIAYAKKIISDTEAKKNISPAD